MNSHQQLPEHGATPATDRFLASTHEVLNQPPALENYNLFSQKMDPNLFFGGPPPPRCE